MNIILAGVALMAAMGALIVTVWLWRKLREQHRRTHLLSKEVASIGVQLVELSRAASRNEARARLGAAGKSVELYAQHGEEFLLWQRCAFKANGVFIEIGAYDGVSLSNSLFFEQIGWSGLLVEAHPGLAAKCRSARPAAAVVHAALGATDGGSVTFSMVKGEQGLDTLSFVSTTDRQLRRIESRHGSIERVDVPARTLQSVVREVNLVEVDWMSIDVEGAELDVLKGANLDEFRPRLILVEDNSGGADDTVSRYLATQGYRWDARVGCNDLYVRAK